MEKLYEAKKDNMRVWVDYDSSPDSPRDGHGLGKIVGEMNGYDLFDQAAENTNMYSSWEEWRKAELPKDARYLPVYAYIHGNIRLSTTSFNDRWDSGQIGYIFATHAEIRKHYEAKRVTPLLAAKALEEMKEEITMFDRYLNATYYYVRAEMDGEEVFSSGTMTAADLDDFLMELPAGFEPLISELKKQMK